MTIVLYIYIPDRNSPPPRPPEAPKAKLLLPKLSGRTQGGFLDAWRRIPAENPGRLAAMEDIFMLYYIALYQIIFNYIKLH